MKLLHLELQLLLAPLFHAMVYISIFLNHIRNIIKGKMSTWLDIYNTITPDGVLQLRRGGGGVQKEL